MLSQLDIDHHMRVSSGSPGIPAASSTLDEGLESSFVGPALGLDVRFEPAGSRATWHLRGEALGLHSDTELDARQTVNFAGVVPQPSDVTLTHTTEQTDFSGRFTFGAGLEYSLGQLILGLEGTVDYWSFVPTVNNPVAEVGSELGVATADPATARIDDDDMLSARVMFTAKLPIF